MMTTGWMSCGSIVPAQVLTSPNEAISTKWFTIKNDSPNSVRVGAISTAALGLAPPFAVTGNDCDPATELPARLGHCAFAISYSPTTLTSSSGAFNVTWSVSGDSTPNTLARPIAGSGVALETIAQLAVGWRHNCAAFTNGNVRCWGEQMYGALGDAFALGQPDHGNDPLYSYIGDDELPAARAPIQLGGTVAKFALGVEHSCAHLTDGRVRCWGRGSFGALGYGNTRHVGDTEHPSDAGDVQIGGTVVQLAANGYHTCAVLSTGNVKCWGLNAYHALGYPSSGDIGDNELPSSVGTVNVGGPVAFTCKITDNNTTDSNTVYFAATVGSETTAAATGGRRAGRPRGSIRRRRRR